MRRVVVLVLDPGPEAAIERLERLRVSASSSVGRSWARTVRNQRSHLPLSLRQIGAGVDERHAEFRADQREMARAIRRAVVDVEPLRNAAAADRALEDRQEGGDALAAREGRVRHEPRRIVEQRDQIGLVPPPVLLVEDARARA